RSSPHAPSFPTRRSPDLVLAAGLVGGGDEHCRRLLEGGGQGGEHTLDLRVVEHGVQAVGAEQGDVPGGEPVLDHVQLDRLLGPHDRKSTRLNSSHEWTSY